ncbi:MAG: acetate--CoA ligase family protein, partial [Bacteroidales bacterium]|nr:acetate--CoA ligase family protein [Bacteroidales bacterium]
AIIESSNDGYLMPESVSALLDAAGISRVEERVVKSPDELIQAFDHMGGLVVMKVVGPVHKSDIGGVVLGVNSKKQALVEFDRLMKIDQTVAVLVQTMASGTELFAGAKKEDKFGHLVMAGLGGIFIEVLKDVNTGLVPLSEKEADTMIKSLRGYKLLEGVRGAEGVDIDKFREIILRVSLLLEAAPEIFEMDLNPLLGSANNVVAVDARIRVESQGHAPQV